jgi:hypothetical protein
MGPGQPPQDSRAANVLCESSPAIRGGIFPDAWQGEATGAGDDVGVGHANRRAERGRNPRTNVPQLRAVLDRRAAASARRPARHQHGVDGRRTVTAAVNSRVHGQRKGVNHVGDLFRMLARAFKNENLMVNPHYGGRQSNASPSLATFHNPDLQRNIEILSDHRRSEDSARRFAPVNVRTSSLRWKEPVPSQRCAW